MKKIVCMLLAACMALSLAACGGKQAEPETKEWSRQGYFADESEDMLTVIWMDDIDEPGWYVAFLNGEDWIADSYGGTLPQEGSSLHGPLASNGDKGDLTVTVSEEGENGLLLVVEGGESYHFTPMEMPEATIFIHVNVDGWGYTDYAVGDEAPELDPEYPFQSHQINLGEPATYTFAAWPQAGNLFVKWTKNGEDFSTEPQITVLLDESADFVAVFEEDPDWQNPVMNFIGEYQCDQAHAQVMCSGFEDAWITIEQGGGASELTRWDIYGRFDPETLTIAYSGSTKQSLAYDDNGEVTSEEVVYEDGTGTVVFHEDGTFTWHEDLSESGTDMLFAWLPVSDQDEAQIANPWAEITEEEAKEKCARLFKAPEGAEVQAWLMCEELGDPANGVGPLIQLSFALDGMNYTARAQSGAEEDADISGLYTEWTAGPADVTLANWGGGRMAGKTFRAVNDTGYIDLITWYDVEIGIKYSLSVAAADLDGFDIQAVAEQMYAEENEPSQA